jgi:thiamine-phosphate pyrophosphorylase
LVNLLLLTDRVQARRPLEEVIAGAVDGGARTVVLREEDLPEGERAELAAALRALLEPVGGTLYVTGIDYPGLFCHSYEELVRAAGAPFVTVSPVFPSRSKPGYGPPLGLAALTRMCCTVRTPVYALGGIDSPDRVRSCLSEGAAGVAVMGAVMRSDVPFRTVKELLAA